LQIHYIWGIFRKKLRASYVCSKTPYLLHFMNGPLAQLVEHLTFNQVVLGSSPRRLTFYKLTNR
jgi:hypothetical protein